MELQAFANLGSFVLAPILLLAVLKRQEVLAAVQMSLQWVLYRGLMSTSLA